MVKEKLQISRFVQNVEENSSAKHEVFYILMKSCRSTQMTASSAMVVSWFCVSSSQKYLIIANAAIP